MSHDEQLAWEERAGKPAAAAAFGAAFMGLIASIYLQVASGGASDADEYLRKAEENPADFIVSGTLLALGAVLMIPALVYLYRATRYRRPELMRAALYLVVLGALTVAVIAVWRSVETTNIADEFFPFEGRDVEEAAEDELRDALDPAVQGVGYGGSIAIAFAMVMIALNAMRAGLLSRFMGILGIFVGIVLVIPLGVQILQLFWFAALGLLFLNRWPGGRGPAWQTGEAIPWPSAMEQREEIERRRAEREGVIEPAGPEPDAEAEGEPEAARPASRKRRKKKR